MPSAIILLNTAIGTEKAVLSSLRGHENVSEAYAVQSAYDIVAKVKAETPVKLTAVIDRIRRSVLLPKSASIVTMLIVEGSTNH